MKRKLSYRHYFLLGKLLGQIRSVGIKEALDKEVARQSGLSVREKYMSSMRSFVRFNINPINASYVIDRAIYWADTEKGYDFWNDKFGLPQVQINEKL